MNDDTKKLSQTEEKSSAPELHFDSKNIKRKADTEYFIKPEKNKKEKQNKRIKHKKKSTHKVLIPAALIVIICMTVSCAYFIGRELLVGDITMGDMASQTDESVSVKYSLSSYSERAIESYKNGNRENGDELVLAIIHRETAGNIMTATEKILNDVNDVNIKAFILSSRADALLEMDPGRYNEQIWIDATYAHENSPSLETCNLLIKIADYRGDRQTADYYRGQLSSFEQQLSQDGEG